MSDIAKICEPAVRALQGLITILFGSARASADSARTRAALLIPEALFIFGLGAASVSVAASLARAQAASPEPSNPTVSLADVASEVETASARLRDLRAELTSNATTDTVTKQLPALAREIEARLDETRKIIVQRPALEILDSLEAEWQHLRRKESGSTRELTARLTRLQHQIAEVEDLAKAWEQTRQNAQSSAAPAEVLNRIDAIIAEIKQIHGQAERERLRALTLQGRLAAADARVADALALIGQARDDVRNHLFTRDSLAIWSVVSAQIPGAIVSEGSGSFLRQSEALSIYAEPQLSRFLAHLLLLIALLAASYWTRAKARGSARLNSTLGPSAPVLEQPLAAAFLLSTACIPSIYSEAPRLLWAVFGLLALVPSLFIIGRAAPRVFRCVLYALPVFYLVDQVRTLAAAVPLVPRLLFLAEMFGAVSIALVILRRLKKSPASTTRWNFKIARAALGAASIAAAAFAANAIGYMALGTLLGNALLGGAYFGLILLAGIELLDGLADLSLRLRPLCLLSGVRRYGPLVRRRIRHSLWWLGAIAWAIFVLRKLLLRDSLFAAAQVLLTSQLALGSLRVAVGDLLAFAVTIWVAFLVSRFVRFVLDEEIYPRVPLAPGLPYAISTMIHYVILLVGFLAAVAVLGIDMTKVTILAGAFSVGVGLGLQNVFNNFVSGVILLFERPVKVGDVIQIDDASGVVEYIGIRASIMRTAEGSEVIMPNGKLISERVINWTLTNRQHSIELPIAVAPGADPTKVVSLLERAATSHPLIAKNPPPQALVVRLGPDALGLELRVWTDRVEQSMEIRSDLAIKVSAALAAENIAIH